jgi:hypothetical protein
VASGIRSSHRPDPSTYADTRGGAESFDDETLDEFESLDSTRNFSFTNDLLTAPVYKRLTLNLLSCPETLQRLYQGSPSTRKTGLASYQRRQPRSQTTWPRSDSSVISREQTSGSRSSSQRYMKNTDARTSVERTAVVAFSSSVVTDLMALSSGALDIGASRYLPICSSLRREQMTADEQDTIDLHFLGSTQNGSLYEMATSLDHGADINALSLNNCQTALQLAATTHQDEEALIFLLQYENANIHVRGDHGQGLLHDAVRTAKTKAIQRLLQLGLSMTDEDENGVTPFNLAVEICGSSEPLLTLLRHAARQEDDSEELVDMDPAALHTICRDGPLDAGHASLLL